MQDINKLITNNFNENISYFENNHSELFSKLTALDTAIANGHYKEKYELVYENDGFDVFEKDSNKYLYSKESLAHTLISVNSVNLKNDNSTCESFHRYNFTKDDLTKYEKEKPFTQYLTYTAPIIEYTQKKSTTSKTIKNLDKFVFFGVGLGMHIEAIHKKIGSKIYLLVEDDLELFRLSLFTLNYNSLAKDSTLIFSVFENNDEFMSSASIFLDNSYYYNHYIKEFSLLSHSDEKKNQFIIALASQPHIRFNFLNLLNTYISPLEYLSGNYSVICNSVSFDTPYFRDKPFLLIALGPSLSKNIKYLKQNHHKFIIVAVSASLSFLEKENITPDIIVHLDYSKHAIEHLKKIKNKNFVKNSLCLFSAMTPKDVMEFFDKKQIFLYETQTNYKTNSIKPSSPCVGSLTYQLLIILKAKYIYLLGLDLAIDSKTGETHSGSHLQKQKLKTQANITEEDSVSYYKSLFEIQGNLNKTVLTSPAYYASIFTIEHVATPLINSSQTIFNLSDGVKFSKTIPTKANSLKIKNTIEKQKLQKELIELFSKNSSKNLTNEEINHIDKKIAHATQLQICFNKIDAKSYKISTKYLQNLVSILTSDKADYELCEILDSYLHHISSYIYNLFNMTDDISNNNIYLQEIDKILKIELNKLIQHYIDSLKKGLYARN